MLEQFEICEDLARNDTKLCLNCVYHERHGDKIINHKYFDMHIHTTISTLESYLF